MQSSVSEAIDTASKYGRFYCKFVSANDVGLTGGHQEGIYVAKKAGSLFFTEEGQRGENKEKWIHVHYDPGVPPIRARAIWYGNKTRREYRITRFWAHSPFDKEEQVGNLLILVKASEEDYFLFILDKEEDIESFLSSFSVSLVQNNAVYGLEIKDSEKNKLEYAINEYASQFVREFPITDEIALKARELFFKVIRGNFENLDNSLIRWIDIEFKVFRAIENSVYKPYLTEPFGDMEKLIDTANSILNRRKSRAGKSLEHHIDFALTQHGIPFAHPGITEGKKKPDFILPSNKAYADPAFEIGDLTFLGAKTTCKDRWRQILTEADRIPEKHLLTLQQGISKNQLKEMKEQQVILVVPKAYHKMYPPEFQDDLVCVNSFFAQMKEKYCG